MKTKAPTAISDHPDVISKRAEITAIEMRLKQAERREQAARARLRDLVPAIRTADVEKRKTSTADKVKKLLGGGVISSADPAAEVAAADREQDLLRNALIELHDQLRAIVGELSDEFATDYLAPLVRADTVQIYEHLALAAAGMARVRGRTADALRLGYHVSSGSCPDIIPPAAWGLGDPASAGSELARMRNALVTKGWIK